MLQIDREEAGIPALIVAIINQAVNDYRSDYTTRVHPDAGAFLQAAGLLTEHGTVVWQGKAWSRTGQNGTDGVLASG